MRLSPESIAALKDAAHNRNLMFQYHAKERADWQGLLDNPANWRRPGPDPDGQRRRIQAHRAEEHQQAVAYREQHNAIVRDLEMNR